MNLPEGRLPPSAGKTTKLMTRVFREPGKSPKFSRARELRHLRYSAAGARIVSSFAFKSHRVTNTRDPFAELKLRAAQSPNYKLESDPLCQYFRVNDGALTDPFLLHMSMGFATDVLI